MLQLQKEVTKGVIFIRVEGKLDGNTFKTFYKEVKDLLYNQGMHYYVFNFLDTKVNNKNIYNKLQLILIEIFLNCGKVALCGLENSIKKTLWKREDSLYYINNEFEAFNYLVI